MGSLIQRLVVFFWGPTWTLAAWCESREDFRSFRLDRIAQAERLDDTFRDEPGRTLASPAAP